MKLRCIIVDDEPMARKGMGEELREIAFLELAGIAENACQAMDLVYRLHPDCIFLDIGMPGLSGLDLIRSLPSPPMIIIVTAYPEHALEGFALDVVDYLIKPVSFPRLLKACCKARGFHVLRQQAGKASSGDPASTGPDKYFFVKSGGIYEKILFRDLLFVEAADNYVFLHIPGKKIMTYDTLKNMENILPAHDFLKVHKSYIVAVDKVTRVEGQTLAIGGFSIPVSRSLKDLVRERVIRK